MTIDPQEPSESSYSADGITIYSPAEHARKRPGMYIGSTDSRGLHYLVLELLDHFVAEWSAGLCKRLGVELLADSGCCIHDDGAGIPVDIVETYNQRIAELLLTRGFSGSGRLSHWCRPSMYRVGLPVVNALSERLLIRISRDGKLWEQEYHRGVAAGPMEAMCDTSETGTCLTFWPDSQIFKETCEFDHQSLRVRLRELSFLNSGLEISFRNRSEPDTPSEVFLSKDGVVEFLQFINHAELAAHPCICIRASESDTDGRAPTIEAAIQWVMSPIETTRSYVNDYETTAGGTHVHGFRRGLLSAIHTLSDKDRDEGTGRLTVEHILAGLTVILSVRVPEPQFSGATRATLNNPEVASFVEKVVSQQLLDYLKTHPAEADAILKRVRRGTNSYS